MVILTLLDAKEKTSLRQWQFPEQTQIWVGRAPENDVVLSNPLVSRRHLELRQVAGATKPVWELVCHSRNGTFVNKQRVEQASFSNETLIQLAQGGILLRFQVVPAIAPGMPRSPKLPKLPNSQPQKPVCTHAGNSPKNLFCVHCGQPVNVEKTIRQYQVLRVLGKGGMGTTYLMWNPAAVLPSGQVKGMLQVLKEMNPDIVRIPKARELFEREAAILRSLDHPGIPRFYDFFSEAGKKYLVMELLHGQDLEKRVQQKGVVPLRQAIGWMIQTCEVLDYLHDRATPIIHRDIKPGNLLVQTTTDRIVVLDFGAVKITEMYSGTRIGAEGFSAPEQIQGRPVPQSDLYAIAPTLIYLLTGESPQQFYKKRNGSYRFVVEGIPDLTPPLQQVIERVTELRPSDRYATAKELAQALSRCL